MVNNTCRYGMFSFMDGFSGYNQVKMSAEDAHKTAFQTPYGNFYYVVMPFGLKNAVATYQRAMVAIFHDMMHQIMEVYIDDVVVKSRDREDHLDHLRRVFNRCRKYRLKMNPLKCAFGVTSGKLFGFVVTNEGIQFDPNKVEAITTMRAPVNVKELQTFIGRISYVRRFIPGLAQLLSVFTPLLKKNKQFEWGEHQERAFQKLKECFVITKVLRPPVKGEPLYLYTTFTNVAIGELLGQDIGNDQLRPIHYINRGFRDAEFRTACWLLQLSEFELKYQRSKGVRGQAFADLLAAFPGMDMTEISDKIPGEVAEVEEEERWTMFSDGSSYGSYGGAGIVFETPKKELMSFAFKLDFECSNNVAEYEALILGLRMAEELKLGAIDVKGDSKLVRNHISSDFQVKEAHLVPYRAEDQELIARRGSAVVEYTGRSSNRHADALATLAAKLPLNEADEGTIVVKRRALPSTWKEDAAFELKDDWRTAYLEDLTKTADEQLLPTKVLKQFVVVRGALYFRTSGGALSRCVGKT
ncbi:uncharacterized protein LOC113342271 [Papaver somniferum]|uniref:uncharacterized protein LOC113342271 n=1 Tax=Papaver somniferum TaxID=3469 RepID=UPI000E6F6919|nr:uncharacterized protein LOC113342271 [Papaver somniferum]